MPAFDNLLIVVAVAFAAPLLLGFFPHVKLPSVVLEILAGIVIGPSVLGIVDVDDSVSVIAVIGLAFLLFLAGLEIEFDKLRGPVLRLTLMGFAASFAIAVFVALKTAERSSLLRQDLIRLQDTTAQIRVRGAVVLLVGFAAIADSLGLESILGAFMAGAILSLLDRDEAMTHPEFRRKLEAVGFGIFIPVFFVSSGVNYDLAALLASASNVVMVPIFLAALVAVRGLPALLYRGLLDNRRIAIAGLMQATSLPFIVAATAIGQGLHL